jgi:hypothetical protein
VVAPMIEAKRAFTETWLTDIEGSVREMIDAHPALYKLPRQDKENAAACAARHLLLAIRGRSIAELDYHHP